MASQDVIELGSSDEDAEPLPKKARIQKSIPNAMVCIPNKFRDVTIKPTKTVMLPKLLNTDKINPLAITKTLGKGVTVKKVTHTSVSPVAAVSKSKINGKPLQKTAGKPVVQNPTTKQPSPVIIFASSGNNSNCNVRPGIHNQAQSALASGRLPKGKINVISQPKLIKPAVNNKKISYVTTPVRLNFPNPIILPPTITVKKTATVKRINAVKMQTVKRKPKLSLKKPQEVLTFNLDDDDGPSAATTSSPQWYLRPEHETSKVEEENNKEPEGTKFVEITIEDSPIKPAPNKRACEIGTELAITIDDSPVKPIPEKNKPVSGSDDEHDNNIKVPQSKKKLEYPHTNCGDTIEIELEPLEQVDVEYNAKETCADNSEPENKMEEPESCRSFNENNNLRKNKKEDVVLVQTIDADIKTDKGDNSGDPFQHVKITNTSTPKKNKSKREEQEANDADVFITNDDVRNEFHPVYQRLIDLCFLLENSEDMKTIVEKKIKGYYRKVPKEYTESEEFIDMVSSKILAMKAAPEKLYLYIKDIVDELNLQKKLAKAQAAENKETKSAEPDSFLYGKDSEFDTHRQRQIRKLEKTIKKLHRAIQKLEEQEVDFDDEDDSVYLLTERYKERMVRVYAKFCQLTNTKMPSEPRIQIDARPGKPTGPAKRLEKWINKKVPIGTPLPFPDFHDVLRCVREANDEDKLGWNEADIMEEARDLFTRCGKKLQRRRQENEWRTAASRIAAEVDPAENNNELKKRLEENRQLGNKKETEIFNKYADRQNLLKLEAVEIGDQEAEESPVESGDEDANEEENVSLQNTTKRKERLKRLIQEKSIKLTEKKDVLTEKPNIISEENENQRKELIDGKPVTSSRTLETVGLTPEDESEVKSKDSVNDVNSEIEKESNVDKSRPEKKNEDIHETHSISDDSSQVESDIDELHLLQKLHSENDNRTSTLDSSDSESLIAISDTLESCGDAKNKQQGEDIISIENSSYSEPEIDNDDCVDNNAEMNKSVEKLIHSNLEVEYSTDGVEHVQNKTNNDEYNDFVENILLASSGEESDTQNEETITENENVDSFVNSKDDLISIDETVVDNQCIESTNGELLKSDGAVDKSNFNKEHFVDDSDKNTADKDNAVDKIGVPDNDKNDGILIETSLARNNNQQHGRNEKTSSNEKKTDINSISPVEKNLDQECKEKKCIEVVSTQKEKVKDLPDKKIMNDDSTVEKSLDTAAESINMISSSEENIGTYEENSQSEAHEKLLKISDVSFKGEGIVANDKDVIANENSEINDHITNDEDVVMEFDENHENPNLDEVTKNIESIDSSHDGANMCSDVAQAKVISDIDQSVENMDVDECGKSSKERAENLSEA